MSSAWVVLADDDQRYRPWGLQILERAITDDESGARLAYSYDTYTLTPDGVAVLGGSRPLPWSGHALFAIRVDLLDGFEAFSACVAQPASLVPRAHTVTAHSAASVRPLDSHRCVNVCTLPASVLRTGRGQSHAASTMMTSWSPCTSRWV